MAESSGIKLPAPIALLQKVLALVFCLVRMEYDQARLIDQREAVAERQYWVNQRERLFRQKRGTTRHIASDVGQFCDAIFGVDSHGGKVFEFVRRQNRIKVECRTFAIEVD